MDEILADVRAKAVQVGLWARYDFPMVVTTGTNRELSK